MTLSLETKCAFIYCCVQLTERNVFYAECITVLGDQNYSIRSESFASTKRIPETFANKSISRNTISYEVEQRKICGRVRSQRNCQENIVFRILQWVEF